jgi:lipopolysaccharide export system protein LptA
MRGERLVVNTVSGDARMEGGGQRSGQRVRTVIYPGAKPGAPK